MSFSYSKISLYERCPKKYFFKYIEKIVVPFEDKPVFEKGRFIHHILEHYPDLPEFKFKFKEVEDCKNKYLTETNKLITNNKKVNFFLNKDILLHREKEFFLDENLKEVKTREESIINGIIDYVGQYNDNIILVDWKTGLTQKFASLNQLKFYSLYIFNNFLTINKLKVFLFFVEQDAYIHEDITREDSEKIKEKYLNLIENISTDQEYKCKKKEDCISCEYYEICKPFKVKLTKEK